MRLGAIVIDSGDSQTLSSFYAALLQWTKETPDDEWIIVHSEDGSGTPLVFQEVENYRRPVWPAEKDAQQQMLHLDFYVKAEEYRQALDHAIACGAIPANDQLAEEWTVLLDPAGHPFCIIPLPLTLS